MLDNFVISNPLDNNIGVLILNKCGLKYTNFQIFPRTSRCSMPSAFCKATTLKCKTRRWYKTQRMGTDFWPLLYKSYASHRNQTV